MDYHSHHVLPDGHCKGLELASAGSVTIKGVMGSILMARLSGVPPLPIRTYPYIGNAGVANIAAKRNGIRDLMRRIKTYRKPFEIRVIGVTIPFWSR